MTEQPDIGSWVLADKEIADYIVGGHWNSPETVPVRVLEHRTMNSAEYPLYCLVDAGRPRPKAVNTYWFTRYATDAEILEHKLTL